MAYQQELRRILRTNPTVVGYSASLKPELVRGRPSGRMAIRVYVSRKIPEHRLPASQRLPDEIDGIPVDVVAIGRQELLQAAAPGRAQRYRPMVGGISVGPRSPLASGALQFGTLGYFLVGPPHTQPQDPPYDWYILSCAHILEPGGSGGREVIQPAAGGGDGGQFPPDAVAIETEYTYDNLDAAVARIDEGAAGEILGLPAPSGTKRPTDGLAVAKSGRTTAVTYGVIIDDDATVPALHGPRRESTGVILIRSGRRPFCDHGDSGSLVIDPVAEQAVGLLYAGYVDSRGRVIGVAFPIARVLRAFPRRSLVAPGAHYPR